MRSLLVIAVVLLASVYAETEIPLAIRPQFPNIYYDSISNTRITNGELADQGQFPYQVGLSLEFEDGNAWCGGTLLSDRWILTAAHCTDGANGVTVYLGAKDIQDEFERGQQRVYAAKANIIVHENWNSEQLLNDISLIKMPVSVAFNNLIQPATLPKKSDVNSTYVGETVVASGWGRDSDSATSISQFLRYVEVPILPNNKCAVAFFGLVTENMICINGKSGKSTCNGDSGGPLVYRDGNVNYVIGATSFGHGLGCSLGFPAVFTRVTAYLDWIEEKTGLVNH